MNFNIPSGCFFPTVNLMINSVDFFLDHPVFVLKKQNYLLDQSEIIKLESNSVRHLVWDALISTFFPGVVFFLASRRPASFSGVNLFTVLYRDFRIKLLLYFFSLINKYVCNVTDREKDISFKFELKF